MIAQQERRALLLCACRLLPDSSHRTPQRSWLLPDYDLLKALRGPSARTALLTASQHSLKVSRGARRRRLPRSARRAFGLGSSNPALLRRWLGCGALWRASFVAMPPVAALLGTLETPPPRRCTRLTPPSVHVASAATMATQLSVDALVDMFSSLSAATVKVRGCRALLLLLAHPLPAPQRPRSPACHPVPTWPAGVNCRMWWSSAATTVKSRWSTCWPWPTRPRDPNGWRPRLPRHAHARCGLRCRLRGRAEHGVAKFVLA